MNIDKSFKSEEADDAERLLVADHVEVDQLIRDLLDALDNGDAALAFGRLDLLWARLAMHIRAENLHLFPSILKAVEVGDAKFETLTLEKASEAIARLRNDHDFFMHELADSVKTIREVRVTNQSSETTKQLYEVKQRIIAVGKRLKEHNQLEEELVYRWPKILLDESAQTHLAEQVRQEIENLPPRFTAETSGT